MLQWVYVILFTIFASWSHTEIKELQMFGEKTLRTGLDLKYW